RLHPLDQVMEMLEAQKHRRFLKTHLPLDALVFAPQAKYLYIGRDGRDVAWSLYNHHAGFSDRAYELINSLPGRVGPPWNGQPATSSSTIASGLTAAVYRWRDRSGNTIKDGGTRGTCPTSCSCISINLKTDLPGEMRRIASFLDIKVEEELWPSLV